MYIHPWLKLVLKIAVNMFALRVCYIKEKFLTLKKMINTFNINLECIFSFKSYIKAFDSMHNEMLPGRALKTNAFYISVQSAQ
jgi:hypothetical protein